MPTIKDLRPSSDATFNGLLTSYKTMIGLERFTQEALELGSKDLVLAERLLLELLRLSWELSTLLVASRIWRK